MDIARPELKKKKRRRQYVIGAAVAACLLVAVAGLAALGPAIPSVERSSVLVDQVKRGELLREVRGPGTLVPKEIRWIAAETAAHVEHIVIKPGAIVKPDTIILELSNPEVDDQLLAAKTAVTAAQSDLAAKRTDLNSKLLDEQSQHAQAKSEYETARMQAEAEKPVAEKGVIPAVQYKKSLVVLEQSKNRMDLEEQRVVEFRRNIESQLASTLASGPSWKGQCYPTPAHYARNSTQFARTHGIS